jgi:hypothetical protein
VPGFLLLRCRWLLVAAARQTFSENKGKEVIVVAVDATTIITTTMSASSFAPPPFPAPRMADGRLFTDYRPRCVADMSYQPDEPQFQGSYAYRQFLIHNADAVIADMREQSRAAAYSGVCKSSDPRAAGTMLPEGDRFECDKVACRRVATSAGASGAPSLGTGRDYGDDGPAGPQRAAREAFMQAATAAQQQQQQQQAAGGCASCRGQASPSSDDESAAVGGVNYFPLPGARPEPLQRAAVPSGYAGFGFGS